MILELQNLNFIKNLIYLLLFSLFLLISPEVHRTPNGGVPRTVAKKFYEIRARRETILSKTNPICGKPQMNVTSFTINNYEENRPPNPPKANPIQTQFNPIKSQLKPISNPISKKARNERK